MTHKSFEERARWILADRRPYTVCSALGIGRGVVDGVFRRYSLPEPSSVTILCKSENVSLSWLLYGEGKPCLVTTCIDDTVTADAVATRLTDDSWAGYLLFDSARLALVLALPVEQLVNQKWVSYQQVEIIVGAIGEEALQTIHGFIGKRDFYQKAISDTAMNGLIEGMYSTFRLLNEEDGLLKEATPLTPDHDFFKSTVKTKTISNRDELKLINIYRSLSPEKKKTWLEIGQAFAQLEELTTP